MQLYPGEDDTVRSAKVLCEGEECLIPIGHTVTLEVNERHSDCNSDVASYEVNDENELVNAEREINNSECEVVEDSHELVDEPETLSNDSSKRQNPKDFHRVRARPKRKTALAQREKMKSFTPEGKL